MMKKILFLHGFYASGQCVPAMALREAFAGRAEVLTPDLPMHSKEALQAIRELIGREKPDLLVGNSCGSFYAQMLAPVVGIVSMIAGVAGCAVFSSYRDPHLQRTLDVYAGIPEFLENFEASEQEMTKYIIGTFSGLDIPFTPSLFGSLSMRAYINGITQEMRQKMRDEILSAEAGDIRSLAPAVKSALDDGYICVVGSETEIEKNRDLFKSIETLV